MIAYLLCAWLVAADVAQGEGRAKADLRTESEPVEQQIVEENKKINQIQEQATAMNEESEAVLETVGSVIAETKTDIDIGTTQAMTYNNLAGLQNGINAEDKAVNFKGTNSGTATLNTLVEKEAQTDEELGGVKNEIGALQTDMVNRRKVLDAQLDAVEHACQNLHLWTKHATPIVNIQEEALFQIAGWTNHLESQIIQVSSMLARIEQKLTGRAENLMDVDTEVEAKMIGHPIKIEGEAEPAAEA